jgi:hypothetical protein
MKNESHKMHRRAFVKKVGIATAGAFVAPYLLPSGRLFAKTGGAIADHVVLVMFAGGVRMQETILQGYLNDSQGLGPSYAGNVLNNMLTGAAPNLKIVHGTGPGGINPIPPILSSSLQQQGTIFPEARCTAASHYIGYTGLIQGNTAYSQGLRQKPTYPTIFEYLRRHGGYKATKTWFIGNDIGASIPLLNYSEHPQYGAKYGANFFAPLVTFGSKGKKYLANAKVYHPQDELGPMYKMKYFLDNSFANVANPLPDLKNTADEKQDIKAFMKSMFDKTSNNSIAMPPVSDSRDLQTIGYTCEVLSWFKPNLTVVILGDVDGCHASFTSYLAALHRADHAVGHLWNHIQTNIPEMAGNTVMIVSPECGRDKDPNVIKDINNWYSFDHSDNNALRVFNMMVGKGVPSNMVVGSEANPVGLNMDVVPTIAEILGIKNEVMTANSGSSFFYPGTMSMFDRI